MSLPIQTVFPSKSIVAPISSAAPHIVRSRLVEQPARINGDYSYTGNSELIFDVTSASEFVDFSRSYLRFDLSCSLTNNAVDVAGKYLAEGGAHSLIRDLEIRSSSGVVLQRINRYNKWYSQISQCLHSADYVDKCLAREGDSSMPQKEFLEPVSWKSLNDAEISLDAITYTNATKTFADATNLDQYLKVGDTVRIVYNDAAPYNGVEEHRVASVTATGFSITDALAGAANLLATEVKAIYVFRDGSCDATRKKIANTSSSVITMQLAAPLLNMGDLFPMMLLRGGIQVVLRLENPAFCLVSDELAVTAGHSASYTISNPYFVLDMVTPDEELSMNYLRMFKEQGINYAFMDYTHNLESHDGSSGTASFKISTSSQSIRHILMKQQDPRCEVQGSATDDVGVSSFNCDGIAQARKSNLAELQIEIGSERFPQSRPVDVTSIDNAEVLAEIQRCFNTIGVPVSSHRMKPCEFKEVKTSYLEHEQGLRGGVTEAWRMPIAIDTSRDVSPFSGAEARLNDVYVILRWDDVQNLYTSWLDNSTTSQKSRYIHVWLGSDAVLHLSSDGLRLFR